MTGERSHAAPGRAGGVLMSIGATQVLILAVALVRSKVLSVLLGPAGFGIVSTIDQTIVTLASVGALGLPFTALKFMAHSHSDGQGTFRQSFGTFLRALGALAALTTAASVLLILWRPGLFGADLGAYRTALLVAILGVPAAMLAILFVNTLAAAQRGAASALLSLASATTLAAGAVIGVRTGGITGLYVGTAAAGVIATLASLSYLRRSLGLGVRAHGVGLSDELRRNPRVVSFSVLLYVAMAAYSLTMLATRYFVLAGLGDVQVGLLQALFSLSVSMGAVMTPMSNLFFAPLVNRQMPVEAKVKAADDFARQMVAMLVLAALPLVLFPRVVVSVLYSGRFAPAAGMLFVFLLWQCVYQLVNVYLQLLIGLDDVPFFSVLTCAAYAAIAAAFPPLIRTIGIGGVGVALGGGMVLAGIGATLRLRVRYGHTISRVVVLRATLGFGLIALAGWLFRDTAMELTVRGAGTRVAFALGTVTVLWLSMSGIERREAIGMASAAARALRLRPLVRLLGRLETAIA